MSEELLGNSEHRAIVRIGTTVRRPVGWWTPAVHALLNHLESMAFRYSPRVMGIDAQGREVLTFLEGESGAEGWAKIVSEEGLRKFARLLREYHEAVASYRPAGELEWACITGELKPEEIICHGDFGPWNVVWQGDDPVGIVDWDMALPAVPRYDVLYALEYAAPFRDDATCVRWHRFPEVPDRKRRLDVFAQAYGLNDLGHVVRDVAAMQRTVRGYVARLAERGLQPQKDWVAKGQLDAIEKRAQWTEDHEERFI